MKKSLLILIVLLLASAICLVTAHCRVGDSAGAVVLSETVHYGDANAAAGLELTISTNCGRHLFWETLHTFGDAGHTETHFLFSQDEVPYEYEFDYHGVWVNHFGHSGMSSTGGLDFDDINVEASFRPYREMILQCAERAPIEVEYTESFYLADYLDYIPLSINLEIPAYIIQDSEGYRNIVPAGAMGYYDNVAALDTMYDYFRIPVDGREQVRVTLFKDPEGLIRSIDTQPGEDFWVNTVTQSVVAKGGCFFSFIVEDSFGEMADMSLVPGGYGVYLLPFDYSRLKDFGSDEPVPLVELEKLSTVYSFAEGERLLNMELSSDGEDVLLISRDEETCWLTVLDSQTAEQKQRLDIICSAAEFVRCGDGFVIAHDTEKLTLIEKTAEGYRKIFTVDTANDAALGEYFYNDYAMSWNGEKFAIAVSRRGSPGYYRSCGAFVSVYDESGLLFSGEYASSLDDTTLSYRENITELDYSEPYRLSWK